MLLGELAHLLRNLYRDANGDFDFALFSLHAAIIPS
jgi:hypothetical protein